MAKTDPIDPNVPAGTEDPKLGDNRIRELARAIAEYLNVDHYIGADGGAGTGYNEDAAGEHLRVKFTAPLGADPSNAANKGFLYTKDVSGKVELFWEDEDGDVVQLTAAGVFNIALLTSKTITTPTLTSPVLNTGVSGTGVLDEDDMASDSNTQLSTQQAIKAYVDAMSFGDDAVDDDESNSLVKDHAYLANQDGYVGVDVNCTGVNADVTLLKDTDSNPASGGKTLGRFRMQSYSQNTDRHQLFGRVKSGEYFEVTASAATVTITWYPAFGTLVKPTDQD